jgi:hypothetical protein
MNKKMMMKKRDGKRGEGIEGLRKLHAGPRFQHSR